MSTTIDQKVVEMRFDNKLFEKNVATSMSTIDKLKQKLNFSNATKGLEKIQHAAQKCDMQPLAKAVEVVKIKFSALEVMGITALQNITNSAINAGKRMTAALTIDPIKTGFQEYETQINAVQTILANTSSKGTTLDQVNAALDELNKYADMTIYNFTEMTRNIGTFTAAGVDLDTSVQAIKGIANLAAVSGSTSQQASTAMYQLSQALAAGSLKLQDWNSVVNAGMGGQVFQDALKETARVHGIAIDKMIAKEGSFRETLSEGWISSSILTETLAKFTGDLSEAQLKSIGYTDEQVKAITKMGQTANDAATKVKTFTQLWDTLSEAAQSGWTSSWEIMVGDFEQAKERLTRLSDTFSEVINNSADRRNTILEGGFSSRFDMFIKKVNDAGVETEKFQNKVTELAKTHNVNLDEMIKQEGSFEKALRKCFNDKTLNKSILTDALKSLINEMTGTAKATDKMAVSMEKYGEIVKKVINGEFGSGEARIKAIKEAGYDYATVQNLVNEQLGSAKRHISELTEEQKKNADSLSNLSDTQLKNQGYTDEQIKALKELAKEADTAGTSINELIENIEKPSGAELVWDSIFNVIDSVIASAGAVKKAWNDAFHKGMTEDEILEERANQLYSVISALHALTEHIKITDETADKIARTLKGVFAIFNILTTIIGGGLSIAFRGISLILKAFDLNILDVTAVMGDCISKFKDFIFENEYIIKGINMFANAVTIACQWVKQLVENFLKIPEVQLNLQNTEKAIERFSTYINGGIKRIEEFTQRIKAMDNISLKDLDSIFKDFKENVIGYFSNIDVKFGDIVKSALNVKTAMVKNFTTLGSSLDKTKNNIFKILDAIGKKIRDNIGLGEILTVGIGASMIVTVKKLGEVIDKFTSPFEAIGDIAEKFSDVLESCSKALNSFALKTKSQALLNIAISIGILAASIVALTMVDQTKLLGAVGILAGLSIGLIGVSAAMAAISKVGGAKGTTSMLGISASLLILVKALKSMENLDRSKLSGNIKVLLILATSLSAITGILSIIDPQLSKGTFALLAMATALKIMVGALKDMDSMQFNNLGRSIKIITGAMIGLASISLLCKNITLRSAGSILATVVALKIFVDVFDKILSLDTTKIKTNIESVIAIFGSFAVLMISSNFAGKHAASAGIGILAMSAALTLITLNLKILAGMDKYDLQKSSDTVAKIMLVFAAVVAASKFAGKNGIQAGVMIGIMSGAILLLTGSIAILSHMNQEDLKKATKIIGEIVVMFSLLIASTYFAKECKSNLVVMAVTLGLLTVALAGLSMIDEKSLKSATAAIASVMSMFAVIIASTKYSKKATATIISIAGTISILGGIIVILSKLPIKSVISSAASMSVLLLSLSASIALTSKVGRTAPKAYLAMGAMSLVVAGLAAIISTLTTTNPDSVIKIAGGMAALLLSLSTSCLILNAVGSFGASALIGAASMLGIIAAVGALMVGIGALAEYYPDMEKFLNTGLKLLGDIGYGLGSFFGNIIGGFTSGIFLGLPEIGTHLSDFASNLQPFLSSLSNVDENVINGVENLAETILILSSAEIVKGIASWLVGDTDWSTLGDGLASFGEAMVEFSKKTDGIEVDKIENATKAGKAIAEMASALPNSGGLLGEFLGENDMSLFKEQLPTFGIALKGFGDSVNELNVDDIENAAKAGKAIAEMASALPNSGGVLGFFTGNNDMSLFKEQLPTFGIALKGFGDSVSELNVDDIENAAKAGKAIAEMASALPNSGGLLADFLGNNDMAVIGAQLPAFGTAIKGFGENVKELAIEAINNSASAITSIFTIFGSAANNGSVLGFLTGNNMSMMGYNLTSFGQSLVTYSNYMTNVQTEAITATSDAINSIVKMQENLSFSSLSGTDSILTKFGNELSLFGNYFRTYYNYISGMDGSIISSSMSQISEIIDTLSNMNGLDFSGVGQFEEALLNLANNGVKKFTSVFENSSGQVTTAVSVMIGYVSKGIKSNVPICTEEIGSLIKYMQQRFQNEYGSFKTIGTKTIANLKEGLKVDEKEITSPFIKAVKAAIKDIRGYHYKFKDAGKYLVHGFVDGMMKNKYLVDMAAKTIAQTAEDSLKTELDINSPSKVTEKLGGFTGQGFVNGLSGFKDKVYTVASGIAGKAKEGLTSKSLSTNDILGGISGKALDFNSLNLDTSTNKIGTSIISGISEGVETSTDDLKKTVTDAMVEGVLNPVNESIDKISKNSLFGTVAANKLADSYSALMSEFEDTDGIRKADVLIYEYGKSLYKESEQYKNDTESIEEHRAELKKLVEQRADLQKQLAEQSKKGTKEAENEVTSIKSQLEKLETSISSAYDKIKEDEDSMIEHMKETYDSFRTTISDTLKNSIEPLKTSLDTSVDLLKSGLDTEIDIFSEFSESSEVTTESILTNMKAQTKGMKNWQENLKRLADRGLDQGLIDKLTEMGTSGISYVNAFVSMSSKEIKQANADFQKSIAVSDSMTVNKILENMESQVTSVIEWNNDLKALSEKGFATGLLTKLKELGISGANYVKAFMSMTEEEMQRANESFQSSSKLTAQTLLSNFENSLSETKNWVRDIQTLASTGLNSEIINSLSQMGVSGATYVNAFLSMTSSEIERFNKDYTEYLNLPEDAADTLIATFASSKNQISQTFGNVLSNSLNGSGMQLPTKMTELGTKAVDSLGTALENGSKNGTLSQKASDVGTVVYEGINNYVSEKNGKYLGSMICKGLTVGLSSGRNAVVEMARQVAYAAYMAAKRELDVNSPSKKFWSLGNFSIIGLLNGFTDNAGKVISAVKTLGKDMVEQMSSSISVMSGIMDMDTDFSPTIRPVLDLSDVEAGAYKMDSIFGKNRSVSMAMDISRDISHAKVSKELSENTPTSKMSGNITFTQNNYSPKSLSRVEIYRQTKNQISMMKGALADI